MSLAGSVDECQFEHGARDDFEGDILIYRSKFRMQPLPHSFDLNRIQASRQPERNQGIC